MSSSDQNTSSPSPQPTPTEPKAPENSAPASKKTGTDSLLGAAGAVLSGVLLGSKKSGPLAELLGMGLKALLDKKPSTAPTPGGAPTVSKEPLAPGLETLPPLVPAPHPSPPAVAEVPGMPIEPLFSPPPSAAPVDEPAPREVLPPLVPEPHPAPPAVAALPKAAIPESPLVENLGSVQPAVEEPSGPAIQEKAALASLVLPTLPDAPVLEKLAPLSPPPEPPPPPVNVPSLETAQAAPSGGEAPPADPNLTGVATRSLGDFSPWLAEEASPAPAVVEPSPVEPPEPSFSLPNQAVIPAATQVSQELLQEVAPGLLSGVSARGPLSDSALEVDDAWLAEARTFLQTPENLPPRPAVETPLPPSFQAFPVPLLESTSVAEILQPVTQKVLVAEYDSHPLVNIPHVKAPSARVYLPEEFSGLVRPAAEPTTEREEAEDPEGAVEPALLPVEADLAVETLPAEAPEPVLAPSIPDSFPLLEAVEAARDSAQAPSEEIPIPEILAEIPAHPMAAEQVPATTEPVSLSDPEPAFMAEAPEAPILSNTSQPPPVPELLVAGLVEPALPLPEEPVMIEENPFAVVETPEVAGLSEPNVETLFKPESPPTALRTEENPFSIAERQVSESAEPNVEALFTPEAPPIGLKSEQNPFLALGEPAQNPFISASLSPAPPPPPMMMEPALPSPFGDEEWATAPSENPVDQAQAFSDVEPPPVTVIRQAEPPPAKDFASIFGNPLNDSSPMAPQAPIFEKLENTAPEPVEPSTLQKPPFEDNPFAAISGENLLSQPLRSPETENASTEAENPFATIADSAAPAATSAAPEAVFPPKSPQPELAEMPFPSIVPPAPLPNPPAAVEQEEHSPFRIPNDEKSTSSPTHIPAHLREPPTLIEAEKIKSKLEADPVAPFSLENLRTAVPPRHNDPPLSPSKPIFEIEPSGPAPASFPFPVSRATTTAKAPSFAPVTSTALEGDPKPIFAPTAPVEASGARPLFPEKTTSSVALPSRQKNTATTRAKKHSILPWVALLALAGAGAGAYQYREPLQKQWDKLRGVRQMPSQSQLQSRPMPINAPQTTSPAPEPLPPAAPTPDMAQAPPTPSPAPQTLSPGTPPPPDPEVRPAQPANPEPGSPPDAALTEVAKATAAVEAMLKAETPDQMVAASLEGKSIEMRVRDYIGVKPLEPVSFTSIVNESAGEMPDKKKRFVFLVEAEKPATRNRRDPKKHQFLVTACETPDGYRVPWHLYTECKDHALTTYWQATDFLPQQLRVMLSRTQYFGSDVRNADAMMALKIASPNPDDDSQIAFVPRESPLAADLGKKLVWNEQFFVIATFKHVQKSGDQFVELISVDNWGWFPSAPR